MSGANAKSVIGTFVEKNLLSIIAYLIGFGVVYGSGRADQEFQQRQTERLERSIEEIRAVYLRADLQKERDNVISQKLDMIQASVQEIKEQVKR